MIKNKLFIILFINFIFIFCVFFCIEYLCYLKLSKIFPADSSFHFFKFYKVPSLQSYLGSIYKTTKYDGSNNSIIIFGCSTAYGINKESSDNLLSEQDTISYKLSKELKRDVYNLAVPGGGLNEILFQLRNKKLKKRIKKAPEYIIYFYTPEHLRRMVMRCTASDKRYPVVFYKVKNNKKLQNKNFFILEDLYSYNLIMAYLTTKNSKITNSITNIEKLLELYINNINKEIVDNYKNSKFIIIKISTVYNFEDKIFSKYNTIDLTKETGYDIINSKQNNDLYWVDDNCHPNGRYWDMALPIIIKKLKEF